MPFPSLVDAHVNGSRTAPAPNDALPRRTRSYSAARRHTAIVRSLKIAIPFGALVSVVGVLFVTFFNPFGRLPGLTVGPVSISGTKIAMEGPRLTGFRSKDKRPYEVVATTAFQDIRKPNVIELQDMRGKMAIDESGGLANLTSNTGVFDTGSDHLDLSQNVRIWTDRGEEVLLRSASIDMKAGTASSREPIKVTTPTLVLEAESMEMSESGKRMAFVGRVRTQLLRGLDTPKEKNAKLADERPQSVAEPADPRPAKVTRVEAGDIR